MVLFVELTCRAEALSYRHTQLWGRVLRCPEKQRQQQLTAASHEVTTTRQKPLLLLRLLPLPLPGCSAAAAARALVLTETADVKASPTKPHLQTNGEENDEGATAVG